MLMNDLVVSSDDGWTLVPIGVNVGMVIFNNSKDVTIKYRLGNTSTSNGVELKYGEEVTFDADAYVLVESGYNSMIVEGNLTIVLMPT